MSDISKANKTIKVTLGNLKRLDKLKKGDFKRRYKVKSHNDVIEKLLDAYDEYVILKEQQKGIVETGKIAEKTVETTMQEEESPDVCYDCSKIARCVNPWMHNGLNEIKAQHCFEPRNHCVYRTQNKDQNIDCAKDFAKNGKIHQVTKDFCDKCWERKEAFLNRLKKLDAPKETSAPESSLIKPKENIVELPKTIECDGSIYRIEKPKHLLNLPCFQNPMFQCQNPECNKLLQQYMKKH